jgi:hypothetical protein
MLARCRIVDRVISPALVLLRRMVPMTGVSGISDMPDAVPVVRPWFRPVRRSRLRPNHRLLLTDMGPGGDRSSTLAGR